jgi:hypothetical protein
MVPLPDEILDQILMLARRLDGAPTAGEELRGTFDWEMAA